jgi:hypothetical protein
MIPIHETFPTRRDAEVWAAGYRCQYHPAGYGTRLDITKGESDLNMAAPDMLAALKEIIRFVDSVGSEHINRVPFVAARAAIAKAEGETWIVRGYRYSSCD